MCDNTSTNINSFVDQKKKKEGGGLLKKKKIEDIKTP